MFRGFGKLKIKENNTIGKTNYKWIVFIVALTFFISVLLTLVSDSAMPKVHIGAALFILALIVFAGILFDMVGLAVATATETPFHSMAARKVKGARHAIQLIRHAEKVSILCNDVVGDISGIISGSTTAAIVIRFAIAYGYESVLVSLILTGLVAAFTIGGKAAGKSMALKNANRITYTVALLFYYFDKIRKRGRA
ncbi:MAG: hypothetical protein BWY15_00075 [Firmicutes bacterium ADurb.Bin193]|nr:MAG: hypothetical protein BWY15_00075 [Firmicutes bacterium ADurb.Bin193]